MFTGLSAFPLTPLSRNTVDEAAFTGLLDRLTAAQGIHYGLGFHLAPLWELFRVFSSLRVISAVAGYLGLAGRDNLPLPILGLAGEQHSRVAAVVQDLGPLA